MSRPRKISKKRLTTFTKRVYGASILSFFLVACFVLLSAFNQDFDPRQQAAGNQRQNTTCSEFSQSWGEWCVYTFTDLAPDSILPDMQFVSGATAWHRDGIWNLVASGVSAAQSQQASQALFLFQSTDQYGISNWQSRTGSGEGGSVVDRMIESADSVIFPDESSDWRTGAYQITHPSVVPVEVLPVQDDEREHECCDTLFYSYDHIGDDAQRLTSIHQVSLLPWEVGSIQRAGQFGHKNPLLSWADYRNLGAEEVVSVSEGSVTFDPQSRQFYLVHVELQNNGYSQISLAQAPWTNLQFTVAQRGVLNNERAAEPQLVVGPDNKYYLFYTRLGTQNEIWVSQADQIAGPYHSSRAVLIPDQEGSVQSVSAPFVFCNQVTDQWQMYFVGLAGEVQQLHAAFLGQDCSQPPVLR